MNLRGAVQKLELDPCRTLFLRRNDALLVEVEWDWSENFAEQYIFPSYQEAENMCALLSAQGEERVHAVTVSNTDDHLLKERHDRHSAIEAASIPVLMPSPSNLRHPQLRPQKPLQERVAIARRGVRTRMRSRRVVSESDALARWEARKEGDDE